MCVLLDRAQIADAAPSNNIRILMRDEREWMDWLREYRVAVTKRTAGKEKKNTILFRFVFCFVSFFIGSVGQRVRQIGLMGRGVIFLFFFSWFRCAFFCWFRLSNPIQSISFCGTHRVIEINKKISFISSFHSVIWWIHSNLSIVHTSPLPLLKHSSAAAY